MRGFNKTALTASRDTVIGCQTQKVISTWGHVGLVSDDRCPYGYDSLPQISQVL